MAHFWSKEKNILLGYKWQILSYGPLNNHPTAYLFPLIVMENSQLTQSSGWIGISSKSYFEKLTHRETK
jgi:hypothetical protein